VPELITEEGAAPETFAPMINKDGVVGLTNPMGTGLRMETARFNILVKQIESTLKQLDKAIRGLVVMTTDLD